MNRIQRHYLIGSNSHFVNSDKYVHAIFSANFILINNLLPYLFTGFVLLLTPALIISLLISLPKYQGWRWFPTPLHYFLLWQLPTGCSTDNCIKLWLSAGSKRMKLLKSQENSIPLSNAPEVWSSSPKKTCLFQWKWSAGTSRRLLSLGSFYSFPRWPCFPGWPWIPLI